jgi:hypothetical protein
MTTLTVLAALALFQVKHLLADFVLQTEGMVRDKARYGARGGLAHAGVHVALSAPVLVWLAPGLWIVLAVLAAEFVLHYHIDWAKARLSRRWPDGPETRLYWAFHGIDQALHQLTYIGILLVLVL